MGTREPVKWKAILRNDHLAWQAHEPHYGSSETERDRNNQHRMYATARRLAPWAVVPCIWGLLGYVMACRIVESMLRIARTDTSLMGD
jgi:hypothetical protein